MRIMRDILTLDWLYPTNLTKQEVTNKFHFTLLKIMFFWLIVITILFLYMRDDIMTRRALIEEEYKADTTAYRQRVIEYNKGFHEWENRRKMNENNKEREQYGTVKK